MRKDCGMSEVKKMITLGAFLLGAVNAQHSPQQVVRSDAETETEIFSGFSASPLVRFSQHSDKQGQRKYQTIDIVSWLLFNSTQSLPCC